MARSSLQHLGGLFNFILQSLLFIDLHCPVIPAILNGILDCDTALCKIRCVLGYHLNPLSEVVDTYQCDHGRWFPSVPRNINILACVRKYKSDYNHHGCYMIIVSDTYRFRIIRC